MQAQSLRQLIDRAVARDGYIGRFPSAFLQSAPECHDATRERLLTPSGMGLIAGATAVTGLIAAALIKRATRK